MNGFNGYKKGVNLGGWLSQCDHTKERYDSFICKADLEKIVSWGADHVRIPVDYELLEKEDGTPDDSGFVYLDKALEWCGDLGLNMIIDLHKTAGYSFDYLENESGFFDSEKYQERFYKLWDRISARYGKFHDRVAFELLNEVTDQSFCKKWNEIAKTAMGRIRRNAPDTYVLIGGYWNNSPAAVKDLDPPYDDKVVYNCHCYDPLDFTHQGAAWVKEMDQSRRIAFSETGITPEFFEKIFSEALETAKKYNTALYCGEYGVINIVSPEDTVRWFKAVNAAFTKMGIGHSAWSYKEMDFGLSDEHLSGVLDQIIKYL